jgi:hypothetical protein
MTENPLESAMSVVGEPTADGFPSTYRPPIDTARVEVAKGGSYVRAGGAG